MSAKQTPTWDQYIGILLERGYVSRAAICRIKDGKTWAATPAFDVTQEEVFQVGGGFQDGGTKLRESGITLAGCPFTLTRVNNTVMVGRACATGAGCVIYRCGYCFVIGVYDDSGSAGGCFSIVTKMGDFLRYDGY